MELQRAIRNQALAVAAACALSSTAAYAQPAPAPAAGQHETVTGTICRVDSRAGAFDLLTGVGHSVRVRRVRFASDLRVKAGRSEPGISALALGTVCRVECEAGPSGATATGVEVLRTAQGRTP